MTHFGLHVPYMTSVLSSFHLRGPLSGSGLIRGDATDPDTDQNAIRLQNYHASQRTAIKGIMNEIDARVSQGELSTPFEEHYPEPPDYFSQEDFHAAYHHKGFLEMLAKLPKKDVERYFKNLKRREKWDLREQASKTGRFWRQHPGFRARYFPNAGSSIEQYISCLLFETFSDFPSHMSQGESVTQTELSPDVAEGRSSCQDTKLYIPVEVGPVGTHTDFLNAGVYYNS